MYGYVSGLQAIDYINSKIKLLKGVSICFYLYISHRHKIKEEVFLLEKIWQECVSHKEKAMMFQIKKHVHLPPRT